MVHANCDHSVELYALYLQAMKNSIILLLAGVGLSVAVASCKQSANTTAKTANTVIKKDSVVRKDSTHLIGVWLDEEIKTEKGEHVAYELVSQGPKTYIQVITFTEKKLNIDENPAISPSAMELKKSGNKYISVERANEIYMVNQTGDLNIYDETGIIATCKRML